MFQRKHYDNSPLPRVSGVPEPVPGAQAVAPRTLLGGCPPDLALVPGLLLRLLSAGWPGLLVTPDILRLRLLDKARLRLRRGVGAVAHPRGFFHKGESKKLSGLGLPEEEEWRSHSQIAADMAVIRVEFYSTEKTNKVSWTVRKPRKVLGNSITYLYPLWIMYFCCCFCTYFLQISRLLWLYKKVKSQKFSQTYIFTLLSSSNLQLLSQFSPNAKINK